MYDPDKGTWSLTDYQLTPRYSHSVTLLSDGRVLVSGGATNYGLILNTAEVYDPAKGRWFSGGYMTATRYRHPALLLPSGKVLVSGGYLGSGIVADELYDPAVNNWSEIKSMAVSRFRYTATLLPSGKVLVTGGAGSSSVLATASCTHLEGRLPLSLSRGFAPAWPAAWLHSQSASPLGMKVFCCRVSGNGAR